MAKNQQISGDRKQDLVFVGKVLASQSKGKSLSDQIREELPLPVGESHVSGVIEYSMDVKIGEDYETDRFKGVKLDKVLSWVVATSPGFLEDNLRRAATVCVELDRASDEGREVHDVTWFDAKGESHTIKADEVKAEAQRVTAWEKRANDSIAPFAKCIKETVKAKGRIDLDNVELRVRPCDMRMSVPVVRTGDVIETTVERPKKVKVKS